jgi:uncharacterized protein (TIGR02453 family)
METIQKSTLSFLSDLKNNNNREWFLENQAAYRNAKGNFERFIQQVIDRITVFDPILKGLEVKNCAFRINRDVRFSHDKSPYKTNLGAFIVRGGKKNSDKYSGYYLHFEPGGCFIAGGAYMPPAPWLSAIRDKIDNEADKLIKIINGKEFRDYFGQIDGEKLKTPPRGYSADNPNIELLKFKSYLAMCEVNDKLVLSPEYFDYVVNVLKAMKPFNDFLSEY